MVEERNCIMEHWIDVKDHPNYEVSNLGQVRNKKTGKILVPRGGSSNGSLRVHMDGDKILRSSTSRQLVYGHR